MDRGEQPHLEKTIIDFNQYKDYPSGLNFGLWQDAKSIWSGVFAPASDLGDSEELDYLIKKAPQVVERELKSLNKKLPSYREYLERGFVPEAVEAIMQASNSEKIARLDALIAEYNTMIGQENRPRQELDKGHRFTPQQALDIYNRAMVLFNE
ncbi:MAG: hypothetical protein Q8P56_02265 [Candidatus Uhrbacteria bacterium]|nr:hypothetical protein [Candidatus Uhrbacteria bacterium]